MILLTALTHSSLDIKVSATLVDFFHIQFGQGADLLVADTRDLSLDGSVGLFLKQLVAIVYGVFTEGCEGIGKTDVLDLP